MALVRDLSEIAREFEAHALARTDGPAPLRFQAFEEIADRNAQYARDFEQPTGGNTIDAALILVCLLVRDADEVGELLLRQAEHNSAFTHPRSDMVVDILSPTWGSLHFAQVHGSDRVMGKW